MGGEGGSLRVGWGGYGEYGWVGRVGWGGQVHSREKQVGISQSSGLLLLSAQTGDPNKQMNKSYKHCHELLTSFNLLLAFQLILTAGESFQTDANKQMNNPYNHKHQGNANL